MSFTSRTRCVGCPTILGSPGTSVSTNTKFTGVEHSCRPKSSSIGSFSRTLGCCGLMFCSESGCDIDYPPQLDSAGTGGSNSWNSTDVVLRLRPKSSSEGRLYLTLVCRGLMFCSGGEWYIEYPPQLDPAITGGANSWILTDVAPSPRIKSSSEIGSAHV